MTHRPINSCGPRKPNLSRMDRSLTQRVEPMAPARTRTSAGAEGFPVPRVNRRTEQLAPVQPPRMAFIFGNDPLVSPEMNNGSHPNVPARFRTCPSRPRRRLCLRTPSLRRWPSSPHLRLSIPGLVRRVWRVRGGERLYGRLLLALQTRPSGCAAAHAGSPRGLAFGSGADVRSGDPRRHAAGAGAHARTAPLRARPHHRLLRDARRSVGRPSRDAAPGAVSDRRRALRVALDACSRVGPAPGASPFARGPAGDPDVRVRAGSPSPLRTVRTDARTDDGGFQR